MYSKQEFSSRARILFGCLCLLVPTALSAQASKPVPGKMVPLVADSCPVAHGLDWLTLDWNPGFGDGGIVTGLKTFTLTFSPLGGGSSNLNIHRKFILGRTLPSKSTPISNGYFHIAVQVPRRLPPGTYRLVGANAIPLLPAGERHLKFRMTNSPVDSGFCITITSPTPLVQ